MRMCICLVGGGATGALSNYFVQEAKTDIFRFIIIYIFHVNGNVNRIFFFSFLFFGLMDASLLLLDN